MKIEVVLPNDSVRLGAESSLLYTDIIIQQKDGSLCNVEIQKIGYAFPGERCACYSADHLLRQYKRVRGEKGKHFNYRDIKQVYTIVFFEHSPKEFKKFPAEYRHVFRQTSDTGLELELLQEYFFISLDMFRKNKENKNIENELEAWLAFLSFDEPEKIIQLITQYPMFESMYQQVYEICRNTERMVTLYSMELDELDRNTVKYMMDEMQAEMDEMEKKLKEKAKALDEKDKALNEKDKALNEKNKALDEKDELIRKLQAALEKEKNK